MAADLWSLEQDSAVLSHLVPSSASVPTPPWLQTHLSCSRDHLPSCTSIRRSLTMLALLWALPSSDAFTAAPTLQYHLSSSPPLFPSTLITGSVSHSWAPLRWRTRRLLHRRARWHEDMIDRLLLPSLLGLPSLDLPVDRESEPHFIDSFDPAVSGMNLLLVERFDKLLQLAPPSPRTVSVDLYSNPSHSFAYSILLESVFSTVSDSVDPPLIVDSGASCCISPCKGDFESYSQSSAKIKDLSGTNAVGGEGILRWHVLDCNGRAQTISIKGYHIPNASVRLLSPQALYKSLGGHGEQDLMKYLLMLPENVILDAPYGRANLPILPMRSPENTSCFWSRCFSFHTSEQDVWARNILASSNQNPTLAQKELLLWHQLQNISRHRRDSHPSTSSDLVRLHSGPLLPCTYNVPSTACDNLLRAACEISKAIRWLPSVRATHSGHQPHMLLKENHVHPGDCMSCDHFISPVPGRVISSSGHSSSTNGYTCGTIYVDHCSTFLFINHQLTTSASDTIRGKLLLEREAADVGVAIKGYHTDNGVFSSAAFRSHCDDLGQSLRFSGVGAHHQNGVAERAIQTVTNMARANMPHATLHWPDRSFIDLWPLAMNYAVWVFNKLPRTGVGLSPEEMFSGIKCPRSGLPRTHVFGCPVYVLDPRLQDGKKIPKWDSRARQGLFIGFSPRNSSLVPLVLNPRTQHISPQFHVIFDDAFSTVPSLTTVAERDHRFEQLFQSSRECYLDSIDVSSNPVSLDDHWLSPSDLAQLNQERRRDLLSRTPCLRPPSASTTDPVPEGVQPVPPAATMVPLPAPEGVPPSTPVTSPPAPKEVPPASDTSGVPFDDPLPPPAPDGSPVSHRFPSRTRGGTWKDGLALNRRYTHGQWKTGFTCLLSLPHYALSIASSWGQPPPAVANVGRLGSPRHGTARIRHAHIADLALLQGDWSGFGSTISSGSPSIFSAYLQPDLSDDLGSFSITDVQPHILAAKSATNTADNPTYGQAINSPHAEKWWEAMESELTTLETDLQAWELVPRTAEGFLGFDIVWPGSSITLLQVGLTKRIIAALGLCSSLSTPIGTPAETTPLPKDVDGSPASGSFNYVAAVGMLLYLSGHSRPDIGFVVHQCARYTFHPTRRHELALIRIGRFFDSSRYVPPAHTSAILRDLR
eukprot:CCRYP_005282-RA/>CCRYP_005282-RA protein AED:0.23 eAED:0.21 QI:0/0/0/0.75/0/0/4/0/1154